MTYEIWTRNQYGYEFGKPVSKIDGELTADQVKWQLLNADRGSYLLHQLCVVEVADEGEPTVTEAGRWLKEHRG